MSRAFPTARSSALALLVGFLSLGSVPFSSAHFESLASLDSSATDLEAEDLEAGSKPKEPKAKPSAAPEPAEITFYYRRHKITQCKPASVDGERVCEAASLTDEAGNAEVKLNPVDRRGKDDVQRQPVEFKFPKSATRREHVVKLKEGRWELLWKDDDGIARDRFFVVPQDKFDVELETTNGQCTAEKNKCTLEGAKLKQSIELPKERGYQQ